MRGVFRAVGDADPVVGFETIDSVKAVARGIFDHVETAVARKADEVVACARIDRSVFALVIVDVIIACARIDRHFIAAVVEDVIIAGARIDR